MHPTPLRVERDRGDFGSWFLLGCIPNLLGGAGDGQNVGRQPLLASHATLLAVDFHDYANVLQKHLLLMSYIDTFEHEFVGFFGGLPVYHPLETIDDNPPNSTDFNCDPTNLVIGGGGGEHPAFILKRADCAVAHFVTNWRKRYAHTLPVRDDQQEAIWYTPWDDFLDTAISVNPEAVLTFAGWDTRTYHNFYQRCCSAAMHTPYTDKNDGWFEWWVAACLGELIVFSMPELVPTLEQILPAAQSLIKPPLYTNILLPPPGVTLPYGRACIDGQVVQGYSRWRQP